MPILHLVYSTSPSPFYALCSFLRSSPTHCFLFLLSSPSHLLLIFFFYFLFFTLHQCKTLKKLLLVCPISIPKESHVWSLKQLWHLLNVFGANWETADKEKAALAELLPHIMDVQTESQSCLQLRCHIHTSSAEANSN